MAQKKENRLVRFNRQNILEAAERLFAEKGVRQTTMDDIAKAADYSKSTVYVYFKSKDEIYDWIIYTHMCTLRDVTPTAAASAFMEMVRQDARGQPWNSCF